MANKHHNNHNHGGAHGHHHENKANIEHTDLSLGLVVVFFVASGLLVLFTYGLVWFMWDHYSAQADKLASSDYTLANKSRKDLQQKYPERDFNGFYYKKLENNLPSKGPWLEGITAPADLDNAKMSGNLSWPSEGAIQRDKQNKILNSTEMNGKKILSINDVMKELAPTLPVRKSDKRDKELQEYYGDIGAGSAGRVVKPETKEGDKP